MSCFRHLTTLACIAVIAAPAAAAEAPAATAPPVHTYSALVITPAGDLVASVEDVRTWENAAEPHGKIVVRAVHDGRVVETLDPCATCRYSALAWSADGGALAVLGTDAAAGTTQILLLRGEHITTLATLQGIASTPRFAPDGRSLAVLATIAAKKKTGALEAGVPQVGDIGAEPDEQRIAVVALDGGELRLVSPPDTYVYEYGWTPDSKGFVGTAAKGDGDNNWWIAELDGFDLATGAVRRIAKPDMQVSMPTVAPDGRHVMFVGGLMSDFGPTAGDVYEVAAGGGVPVDMTPGFRGSFDSLLWRGKHLYASAVIVDRAALLEFDAGGHAPKILWSAPVTASAADGKVAVSADGRTGASVTEDFGHAPRIIAGAIAGMLPITHDNDGLTVDLDVQSVRWKSDGLDVQGWLVGPASRPPGKRYPMIVHVHGGPSAVVLPSFGTDYSAYTPMHEWVARGYYMFLPNPRGSFGQGAQFTSANYRDFGGGDFRDIMSGVDAAEKAAPIDDHRLGIHGHSYGGFMTMWAVTRTNRFRAAIAGAGLSNWISYYGLNGIDTWMIPFFGASMYDDPAAYRAISPLESIKQVHTPTLLYTGEFDVEVPASQSFEFWHALRAMGVTTELHVYPGEGHLIRQAEHVTDLRRRLPEWFDRYLTP